MNECKLISCLDSMNTGISFHLFVEQLVFRPASELPALLPLACNLQLGKLGEEEDEEDEPAIERRRECTDLGLDLGEREEQVVCHASALALAMTDEARREGEM